MSLPDWSLPGFDLDRFVRETLAEDLGEGLPDGEVRSGVARVELQDGLVGIQRQLDSPALEVAVAQVVVGLHVGRALVDRAPVVLDGFVVQIHERVDIGEHEARLVEARLGAQRAHPVGQHPCVVSAGEVAGDDFRRTDSGIGGSCALPYKPRDRDHGIRFGACHGRPRRGRRPVYTIKSEMFSNGGDNGIRIDL